MANMTRKSFDLEETELARTKRCASRQNISVNRYIAFAVIEKNDGNRGEQRLEAVEGRVIDTLNAFRKEMVQTRLEIVGDAERTSNLNRDDTKETLRRIEKLMKSFVHAFGQQLAEVSGALPTGYPGSHE